MVGLGGEKTTNSLVSAKTQPKTFFFFLSSPASQALVEALTRGENERETDKKRGREGGDSRPN